MCEPMTIAASMMAVQTGTSMMQQQMQYDAAGKQAEAQTEMFRQNRENAYKALGQQYGDINTRQSQEQQRAAEDKEQRTREARAQMARARVAAGEAGITGNSVRAGLNDISGAAARDRSTIDRNLNWTLSELQRNKTSARTSAINKINSVQPGQKPSSAARNLGLASTAAGGAAQIASMQPGNGSFGSSGGQSSGGSSGWYDSATY